MSTTQKVIIIGNLGRDPEMRYTPSGSQVTSFSVATNRRYQNSAGETMDETTWWRVVVWGKQAENCNQYLKKGKKVFVEGRMSIDPATGGPKIWTGQDGSPRASFEITAYQVIFLSPRDEVAGGPISEGVDADFPPPEDDIPF